MSARRVGLVLTLVCLGAGSAFGQGDEDDELAPGLIAEYAAGETSLRRIDGDIAFDWRSGSPDLRLPAGPFRARWSGQILLRAEGKYRWHAYLAGDVTVRIKDAVVLAGRADQPQWITGEETELSFGEQSLDVEYASSGAGRIFLCWSSDQFPLEPVPHHALFHERADVPRGPFPPGAFAVLERRCDRCHGEVAGLSSPPGPSLIHAGAETSRAWLLNQIQHGGGEPGRMPKFGFTREEAEAILAALQSEAKPVDLPEPLVPAELVAKDVDAGRELLSSVGCLACHQWNKQGRTGDFGGPPLDDVAKHRSARWLEAWLSDPAKINPQHRMPVFTLSIDERRQIVSALVAPQATPAVSSIEQPSTASLELGRKLLREARCASCHELPGPKVEMTPGPQWAALNLDGDGCWDAAPKPETRRPQFVGGEVAPVRGFLKTAAKVAGQSSADLRGAQLLIEKGCVNCHDRDGRKGISSLAAELANSIPSLQGRAPWLIPPQLTAVGDRLPDDRLAKAIRGELPKRRLDWLHVRMPRYQHAEPEQAALVAHLIGHDRIPENPPAAPAYPESAGQETTLAGRELLGGKGFSCVACHPVKDFAPKNVALGTRGSNLFQLGERLRRDYFFRWTRAPLRVMPGVEMPSYQRPHASIFPGDMNRQLASLWTALNDPDLPTPVNPGAVEQYWTVGPNDRPRILRDVVTLPGRKKVTIPRAFAVGFPNGHNVLFDLDRAAIRAWTVGDFAQQRAQGKSWFWDLVGTPVLVKESGESDFVIMHADGEKVFFPSDKSAVELWTYDISNDNHSKLHFVYFISWPDQGDYVGGGARIDETWSAAKDGWKRTLEIPEYDNVVIKVSFNARAAGIGQDYDLVRQENSKDQRVPRGKLTVFPFPDVNRNSTLTFFYSKKKSAATAPNPQAKVVISASDNISVVPGFHGKRLPYPQSIMPTALSFNGEGRLFFTSLKGHVYSADDREAKLFAEGLAAPFGILSEVKTYGSEPIDYDSITVAHKPEILILNDDNRDGRPDVATVRATGWGLSDDYHDWTCGLVRDAEGNLFTTLGSDYSDKNRPAGTSLWRGHALKIDPGGRIESLARGLRFPTGVAMTSQQDVFITDQQGLQNTFNELNWLNHRWGRSHRSGRSPDRARSTDRRSPERGQETQSEESAGSGDPRRTEEESAGSGDPRRAALRFGVPSLHEPDKDAPSVPPAVQIPHPWTRSVNGICAIPKSLADRTHPKLFDQLLGCEYDTRFLIRMSWQLVDGVMQGAAYPLCKPSLPGDPHGLLGPLSIAVSPDGDVYVGSIHDSGWQGGLNTGDIVKLTPAGTWPNGLCEIRATPTGFDLEFFHPVDRSRAEEKSRYQISGSTRVWQGSYATPDSGRHTIEIESARLNDGGTIVSLALPGLKPGNVYDVSIGDIGSGKDQSLWPNVGFYTLHKLPK